MTELQFAPQSETQPVRHLSDGIDTYKLTMGQLAFEKHPDAQVTFTLKNRNPEFPLIDYIDIPTLQERLDHIRDQGFTKEEIDYYASLKTTDGKDKFTKPYLNYLSNLRLTEVNIRFDPELGDLAVDATGPWPNVTFWETLVMSEVSEQYYINLLKEKGVSLEEVWAEGNRRLDAKIALLKDRPDVKFMDFGTRRRFSAAWHEHVVRRFMTELPDNFIGTSNPWLAHKLGLKALGTFAHELPMVYSAMADKRGDNPLDGHHEMLDDMLERYPDNTTALSDTYTSKFFFEDFKDQADKWNGLRHDSGDPFQFGEDVINFYKSLGIDPAEKAVVFSDGLDVPKMIKLTDAFNERMHISHGIGTNAVNDLGYRAVNIVMKATNVDGIDTVKLSDNEGKHTGPQAQVDRYKAGVAARLAAEGAYNGSVLA